MFSTPVMRKDLKKKRYEDEEKEQKNTGEQNEKIQKAVKKAKNDLIVYSVLGDRNFMKKKTAARKHTCTSW